MLGSGGKLRDLVKPPDVDNVGRRARRGIDGLVVWVTTRDGLSAVVLS
jgi:hypothetical protein